MARILACIFLWVTIPIILHASELKVEVLETEKPAQDEIMEEGKPPQKTVYEVLDIETEHLNASQRKKYSRAFRGYLSDTGRVALVDSEEPDNDIQSETKSSLPCTTDNCRKPVKRQPEGRHIISSYLIKLDDDKYLIYSKVLDPESGKMIASISIEHNGSLKFLKPSLEKLAQSLINQTDVFPADKRSFLSKSRWHIAALSLTALAIFKNSDETTKHNDLAKINGDIKSQYMCSTDQAEVARLKNLYNSNIDKMKHHQDTIAQMYVVMLLALTWEAHMLLEIYDAYTPSGSKHVNRHWKRFRISPMQNRESDGVVVTFAWKF